MRTTHKRLFDVTIAVTALVILSPVMGLVALLVRLFLGAPVLFVQERPGKDGRLFRMIKFRTMRNAMDSKGNPLPDSQRLTWLGRFLRKSSLDELPELINVLRGEMSLIGPRPLLPRYLDLYTPEQSRRHEVLPGVTGWAQVNGRNSISWDEKFKLDIWYVDHQCFWLDLSILCRTAWKLLRVADTNHQGHVTMPDFDRASSSRVAIIGAGGHIRLVLEALRASGHYVDRIYEDDPQLHGQMLWGVPVIGPLSKLEECPGQKAIIAFSEGPYRREIASRFDCHWVTAVHPGAEVAPSVVIAAGCVVADGVVIKAESALGEHVHICPGAVVDAYSVIQDYASVYEDSIIANKSSVEYSVTCDMQSRSISSKKTGDNAKTQPHSVSDDAESNCCGLVNGAASAVGLVARGDELSGHAA